VQPRAAVTGIPRGNATKTRLLPSGPTASSTIRGEDPAGGKHENHNGWSLKIQEVFTLRQPCGPDDSLAGRTRLRADELLLAGDQKNLALWRVEPASAAVKTLRALFTLLPNRENA
jgi:hypothetical protein